MQGTLGASSIRIWILLAVLWLANMPLRPLLDPDEGRYAEIPREMLVSGDWVTPTLDGLKYFEKPPLQYWVTTALYEVFGVHDWTSRLWSATLAFLCIPMVYAFCTRIGYPRDTALIAAALLASNPYFAITGQINLLDQGFTFFLTLALFACALALRATAAREERNWMLLTWASLALAVLSKGIATLVLAGATLFIYMLASRDASLLKRLHLGLGLPLFLLIAVPWFWVVQSRNPEFAQFFFIHEHFARYLTSVAQREEPWWYFIVIVLFALLPVIWNARGWKLAMTEPGSRVFQVEKFLLIWCGVVLLLFSASHSKLASYVLPMMPALAVLLARSTAAQPHANRRANITVVTLLLLVAVGLVTAGWIRQHEFQREALLWAAVAIGLCVAFLAFTLRRRDASAAIKWSALAALTTACYQALFLCFTAALPARSAAGIAAASADHISAATTIYSVGQYRPTLNFYVRRKLQVYEFVGELEFGMQQAGQDGALDRGQFLQRWRQETDAVAFIAPSAYQDLSASGIPGQVIARDERSIALSRK